MLRFYSEIVDGFQSPRGVGVVQTFSHSYFKHFIYMSFNHLAV